MDWKLHNECEERSVDQWLSDLQKETPPYEETTIYFNGSGWEVLTWKYGFVTNSVSFSNYKEAKEYGVARGAMSLHE